MDTPTPAPRRILVAGVSGAGKTTLCREIARRSGIPHTEIDALFHGPGWTPRPESVAVSQPSWVTEWQYDAARPLLAECADTLVWLDLPFWTVTFPRVVRRTVRRSLRREELWNGNREAPLRSIVTDPVLGRTHPALRVVRLRTRREVRALVATTWPLPRQRGR